MLHGAHAVTVSGWLLLLTAAFIIYGSLYPFSFVQPQSFSWVDLFNGRWWAGSRGDMLANIALFIPYGVFAAFYVAVSPRSWASGLVLIAGLVLALGLQYAQAYVPGRTAAASDALWNTVGMGMGYVLGMLSAAFSTRRSIRSIDRQRVSDIIILLGVCAFEWLPFIPTLDFQTFKDNIKPLLYGSPLSIPDVMTQASIVLLGGAALRGLFSGRAHALLLALIALCALVAGRAFFFTAGLDRSIVVGAIVGLSLTTVMWGRSEQTRVAAVLWILFAALIITGLWPFALKSDPSKFGWVPFAGFLTGDAVGTARSLLGFVLISFSFFIFMERMRGAFIPTAITLALAILGIEVAQCYLQGRSGEVTSVLLVVVSAFLARALNGTTKASMAPRMIARAEPQPVASPSRQATGGSWRSLVPFVLGIGFMAMSLWAVLRVPALPYNVRELFSDGGSVFALILFSIAVIFPGLSARVIGWRLEQARRPWLQLPGWILVAGVLQLALLYLSVTDESVGDISGSNNLFWWVTNRDTWGVWWREVFLALNSPGVIAFFERIVRFTALFGPLVVVLAWMFALSERVRSGRQFSLPWLLSLTFSAAMFLWLCKFIAFDRSSTDNLNELIARDGFFGTGGGAYLYALLFLVCLNAWMIATMRAKSAVHGAVVLLFSITSLPAGWALLQMGLEQHVEKYSSVFSGQQFLLGPDRKALLSSDVLMIRWWIVQMGVVAALAFGAHGGGALISARRHPLSRVADPK